jgi:ribose transport system ATP-binding protein
MLGREMTDMFPQRSVVAPVPPMMQVMDLWPDGLLGPVSFDIKPGEILGLAGQLGSGSGEVLGAIAGARKTRGGQLQMDGRTFLPKSPREAIAAGIGYCSEDRKHDGLFLGRPIIENISSPSLGAISTAGFLSHRRERDLATDIAQKFTVDQSRMNAEAGVLSGGNQQKVALGKWLSIEPKIILVNEPTRGVDVGARAEIYRKLRELADAGAAIVLASTDIQEITNLPDRVLTFYRGMLIGEIAQDQLSAATILKQITDPFNQTNL